MNNPLVSIIIPTYNRAHLISETLDSILYQTYKNWECIIVDDGSTDNTEVVIKGYLKKDSRFKYHIRPESRLKGGNAARNYGFEVSKGDYVNWYDSDDVMLSEKIETHISMFREASNVDATVTNSYLYNFKTKKAYLPWREKLYSSNLLSDFICQEVGWQTGDALWKKSVLNNLKYNENLLSSQDWEFHIKAIYKNINFSFKDVCMSYIRHTESSIKNTYNLNKIKSDFNSRCSILKLNKSKSRIDSKGLKKIELDVYTYLRCFISYKEIKLSLKALYYIFRLLIISKDFKLFYNRLFIYYLKKI